MDSPTLYFFDGWSTGTAEIISYLCYVNAYSLQMLFYVPTIFKAAFLNVWVWVTIRLYARTASNFIDKKNIRWKHKRKSG